MTGPRELTPDPARRPRRLRRSFAQWLVLLTNLGIATACLVAAGAIWFGQNTVDDVDRLAEDLPSAQGELIPVPESTATSTESEGVPVSSTAQIVPIQPTDVAAKNFLLTGTDNNSCVDPNSRYAGAFGERYGSRSDAILILRVDPPSGQAAILSFPRDLWVKLDGGGRGKINQAIGKGNVVRLANTIFNEFGISVDHYINVDFCAFKRIVDEIGGIRIPFEFGAKDRNTGLFVAKPGCRNMKGDEALAYVRSRKYKWLDPDTGKWRDDPAGDLGRVTRQQDFIKRLLQQAINKGARDPFVAAGIIDALVGREGVTLDKDLTARTLLDVASAMRDFDPKKVRTFQIETRSITVGNSDALKPLTESDNMQAVLAVFRGEARMADFVPPQPGDESATTEPPETEADPTDSTLVDGVADTTGPPFSLAEGEVLVQDNPLGIYPPAGARC